MHCYILLFAVAHNDLVINCLHRFLYGCLLILTNWLHNKKLKCALYNISWHLSCALWWQHHSYNCIYYRKNKLVASLCVFAQVCASLPFVSLHLCFLVWLRLCVLVQACLRVQVYTVIYHADVYNCNCNNNCMKNTIT